jgi:hypothetical protein
MHGFEGPTLMRCGEPTRPADIENNTICSEHDRNHLGFACNAAHGFDGEMHIGAGVQKSAGMSSGLESAKIHHDADFGTRICGLQSRDIVGGDMCDESNETECPQSIESAWVGRAVSGIDDAVDR